MLAEVGTLSHEHTNPAVLTRGGAGSILHRGLARHPGWAKRPITIWLAECELHKRMASSLVNRMYSGRGYGADHPLPSAPNCHTFTAASDEGLIGTLTLQVDSPLGLVADGTFKHEIDAFRRVPGAMLCELTRFAFDPSANSRPVLAAVFHVIFIYGSRRYGCTDLLIEVNPRHVRFYEAMLGFRRLGPVKANPCVHAPAQLMWLKVSEIRRRIELQAGDLAGDGHSLYRYFFSKKEERSIIARIAELLGDDRLLTKAA
jgi:hypothetical protein